jgi:hypothetical protein
MTVIPNIFTASRKMRLAVLASAVLGTVACGPTGRLLAILPEQGVGYLGFHPLTREVSYSLQVGQEWCIVRGKERGPLFDEVSEPIYGPDGRLVYLARKGQDWRLEIWGEPAWPPVRLADHVDPRWMRIEFSGDGKSIALAVEEAKGHLLMVDGRRMGRFEKIEDLQWSPAQCFCAIVLTEDGYGIFMKDGVEHVQQTYDFLGLAVTASGDPIVHASNGDASFFGHPDELKKTPYLLIDCWTIASDGRSIAYVAQKGDTDEKVLVVNGKDRLTFRGRARVVVFNPKDPDEVALLIADSDGGRYMMVGDRKIGPFERVGPPIYDAHFYFWILRQNGEHFIIGDRCTPAFDVVDQLQFSPDGQTVTFYARKGRELWHYEYRRRSLPLVSECLK